MEEGINHGSLFSFPVFQILNSVTFARIMTSDQLKDLKSRLEALRRFL